MRAETIYIITLESDTESTRVAAGLYHKYGSRAANGAVVHHGSNGPHTVKNMSHGTVPLTDGIEEKKSTNFRNAWNAVKDVATAQQIVDPRFEVGVYFVVHGLFDEGWMKSPSDLVSTMKAIIPEQAFVRIGKITLVQCLAVSTEARAFNGTAIPDTPDASVLQFLQLLAQNSCRPQVAAWDTLVTAAPGPVDGQFAVNVLAQGAIGRKLIKSDDQWELAKAQREQHKTIFQLNNEGVVIAGPPSTFAQQ